MKGVLDQLGLLYGMPLALLYRSSNDRNTSHARVHPRYGLHPMDGHVQLTRKVEI